jgi:hypothetical protein
LEVVNLIYSDTAVEAPAKESQLGASLAVKYLEIRDTRQIRLEIPAKDDYFRTQKKLLLVSKIVG